MPIQAPAPETVSGLTARIKGGLEQWFSDVWVEGELSNVRIMSSSPHAYFTVKDSGAQLPCAFFNAAANPSARAILRDGAKMRLRGAISVYPPRGAYQLIVRLAEPVGEGELMMRFEALKRRLAAEGLFDAAKKRPLPLLPKAIGIVTSPTGAAIRDMLNVTRRRFAPVRIVIAPARVQGDGAAREIADAIALLNAMPDPPDVMIVGRGGGSIEDLWCFNEEIVARAVRASRIPVVSAVGHEIDFTICDFAADVRAPTPSAAAELVVKNRADLVASVSTLSRSLAFCTSSALSRARSRLDACARSRAFSRPADIVRQSAQRADILSQRMDAALSGAAARARQRLIALSQRPGAALAAVAAARRTRLAGLEGRLCAMDPSAVLSRGWALVRSSKGEVRTLASEFSPGEKFEVVFRDGPLPAIAMGRQETLF